MWGTPKPNQQNVAFVHSITDNDASHSNSHDSKVRRGFKSSFGPALLLKKLIPRETVLVAIASIRNHFTSLT